eukprot:jgi/Botrbrau1/3683/Bobra.0008s0011.2
MGTFPTLRMALGPSGGQAHDIRNSVVISQDGYYVSSSNYACSCRVQVPPTLGSYTWTRASPPRASSRRAFGGFASGRKAPYGLKCQVTSGACLVRAEACLKALIFDCDGVILESEDLHRRAYNATWEHFRVCCPGQNGIVHWDEDFYDMLQNKVGGGKPKMRWYFGNHGWPSSTLFEGGPSNDEERERLVDALQDWKTNKYQEMITGGEVPPREGVLQLMDEARDAGLKVGVCSAATKSSVICVLSSLLGSERFQVCCFCEI